MPATTSALESIKYGNGSLLVLDQLLLPLKSEYVHINSASDGWKVINSMQVRGAPAIALVGCLSIVIELQHKNWMGKSSQEAISEINSLLEYIVSSRPTAVNMKNAATHLKAFCEKISHLTAEEVVKEVIHEIEGMLESDISDNKAIGEHGAAVILENSNQSDKLCILTHCNTGSLATAGYGTALGVIRSIHSKGQLERCFFTETRPYMQGSRLTGFELATEKIPATLVCDSAVSALMSQKQISAVVVGADRVASNGDTANKIGTYQIAVVANYHKVPFYVAAPFTSIDFTMTDGSGIIIEERSPQEMTHFVGERITHPDTECWNVAFDVTPASLITGIITEKGVFKPSELKTL